MANNVAITAGSGTTVGTDDCGGVHISLVKLVDSTEDSTTRTGIAASPLQVSLANTGANSNALVVASHAVTNAGTFAVQVSSALPAGTNAIGKLSANSGVDIGDVDVTSLPALAAGTNLIGRVSSSDETSTIYSGTTALTPKYAAIDAASSGDNTIVAAVTSKKIRVLSLFLVAAGTTTVRFESGASGTALSGQMNLIANTGFALPYNPVGWFETASNTLLNIELSAAISVDGSLTYVEV